MRAGGALPVALGQARGAFGPQVGDLAPDRAGEVGADGLHGARDGAELAESVAGPGDLDEGVRAFEEQMWARAGRWAKITTAGLERLVSPDAGEALALFGGVQSSWLSALRISHGWDDSVECSFDVLAGSGVELVVAMFQVV
ncbi:hypothetical protein Aple_016520 [Acrocarpospora pleiomorpha]|uniref:Uncharacterized protein n=1 Tax=Acrocarpospora pleiomorpha TaxID=90975 RepID=A0A5M3XAP2_9ACTN|nr:hypothetical protein Aple_016520 [Acrocarpospora pleiomorpha]